MAALIWCAIKRRQEKKSGLRSCPLKKREGEKEEKGNAKADIKSLVVVVFYAVDNA